MIISCQNQRYFIRPLAKVDFRPPSPPRLGGECIQSPPELGDLGGIPGFMQEVYSPHTMAIVFPIGGAIALFTQGVISVSAAFNSSLTSQAPLESYDFDGLKDS